MSRNPQKIHGGARQQPRRSNDPWNDPAAWNSNSTTARRAQEKPSSKKSNKEVKVAILKDDSYDTDVEHEDIIEVYNGLDRKKKLLAGEFILALGRKAEFEARAAMDGKPLWRPRGGPPVAPELYQEREDKSENAPDFINRVYEEWLDGHFTRADLRKLDEPCASALRNHETARRTKLPLSELNLPTIKQRYDYLISKGIVPDDPDERRRLANVVSQRKLLEISEI